MKLKMMDDGGFNLLLTWPCFSMYHHILLAYLHKAHRRELLLFSFTQWRYSEQHPQRYSMQIDGTVDQHGTSPSVSLNQEMS